MQQTIPLSLVLETKRSYRHVDQDLSEKFPKKMKMEQIFEMFTVAFSQSMSKTRAYEWYKHFNESREDVKDDNNSEQVKKMILEHRPERLLMILA